MIITFASTKGGVGKTTSAYHIAHELALEGRVLVLDTDPECMATQFAAWRTEPHRPFPVDVIPMEADRVYEEAQRLAPQYAHVLIDVGGWDSDAMRWAMAVADKLIIPCGVSGADGVHTVKVAAKAREVMGIEGANLKGFKVLITRVDTRAKDWADIREYLRDANIECIDAVCYERKAYRLATNDGLVVRERKPLNHAARNEIRKITAEVLAPWAT